jgi:hypothetical protein
MTYPTDLDFVGPGEEGDDIGEGLSNDGDDPEDDQ